MWARVNHRELITFVASFEEPHAPIVIATGVNAFEYSTRHGQAAHRRTQFTSPFDMAGWLSANTAKGDLSLQLQAFLEQCGADYTASDTPVARKSIFLAVKQVFWAVTPTLKKSLQADCSTLTSAVKHAIACIEDLLGTDRPEGASIDRKPLLHHKDQLLFQTVLSRADISACRCMCSAC